MQMKSRCLHKQSSLQSFATRFEPETKMVRLQTDNNMKAKQNNHFKMFCILFFKIWNNLFKDHPMYDYGTFLQAFQIQFYAA